MPDSTVIYGASPNTANVAFVTSPAPDPRPVSPALDLHLRDVVAQIPSGKRGQASATVTTTGVEAGLGYRVTPNFGVASWAGREWAGKSWSAGARATWSF